MHPRCHLIHIIQIQSRNMESGSTGNITNASPNDDDFEHLWSSKPGHTERATKKAVTIFREYLNENDFTTDFENLDKQTLGTILSRFYLEMRKLNGDYYKVASMNAIRTGLNRHMKSEYSEFIDITRDPEFRTANVCYKAAIRQARSAGKGIVLHHSIISDDDLERLYTSRVFDQNTPSGLQLKVWFELMLYIGGWGRENLRELKAEHFVVRTDPKNGREYVALATNTTETREDSEDRVQGDRIYATNTDQCPVASFKKYVSRLNPDGDAFFQTPMPTAPDGLQKPWYKSSALGRHTLGTLMSLLSRQADLSQMYTNHCIRKTRMTILDWEGLATTNKSVPAGGPGHISDGSSSSSTEPCSLSMVSDRMKERVSDILSQSIQTHRLPTAESSVQRAEAEDGFYLECEYEAEDVKPNIRQPDYHLAQFAKSVLETAATKVDAVVNMEIPNVETHHDEYDSPSMSPATGHKVASPGSINSRTIQYFHTRSTATPTPDSSALQTSPAPVMSTSTTPTPCAPPEEGVSIHTHATPAGIHVTSGHTTYPDSVVASHTRDTNAGGSSTVDDQQQPHHPIHLEQQSPFRLRNCNVTINYHPNTANAFSNNNPDTNPRSYPTEYQIRSSQSSSPRAVIDTSSATVATTSSAAGSRTTGASATSAQQHPGPFLLQDCNVTINYFNQ